MRCSSVARIAITAAATRIAAYGRIIVALPLPATTSTRIDDVHRCDTLRESKGYRGDYLEVQTFRGLASVRDFTRREFSAGAPLAFFDIRYVPEIHADGHAYSG